MFYGEYDFFFFLNKNRIKEKSGVMYLVIIKLDNFLWINFNFC